MRIERDENGYRRRTKINPVTDEVKGKAGQTSGIQKELMTKRIRAGKRMYYFDVKSTKSGDDFFVTITESVRRGESGFEKHKIFLYKEDFGKFLTTLHELVDFIQDECLPEYDFRGIPELKMAEPDLEVLTEKIDKEL